ncbi:cytochrome P450 [Aureibacter tunicatorum]|uniref:Cytochrome P450 n=1 Tax=Aureibacter tunicatorum TaxID=866807 RepID=A0AAE3XM99_9BACT|nr:cytochrome P450 [Aureibacter tunicatorum]MDR6239552.1 cytochrome P450 [Aureibacter tunicatorum]BDD04029.1 cytochrome P450 [Aureibacter tunicatorum]
MSTNQIPTAGKNWFSNIQSLSNNTLDFLMDASRDKGDVIKINTGIKTIYLISCPKVTEEILVKQQKSFKKSEAYEILKELGGDGLISAEGETWKRKRVKMNPAFQKNAIKNIFEEMEECVDEFIIDLQSKKQIDLDRTMMDITLKIILRTMFGNQVQIDSEKIYEDLTFSLEHIIKKFWNPFYALSANWNGKNKSFEESRQRFDDIIFKLTNERINMPEEEKGRYNLLDMLIGAMNDEDKPFSLKDVRDEVITTMIAGHETTASALSFTLAELCKHPEHLSKAIEEIDTNYTDNVSGYQLTEKLPFVKAIFEEGLRMYPSAWSIGRIPLENVEASNFSFPKGSDIAIFISGLHRNSTYWKKPDTFDPYRFYNGDNKDMHKCQYVPFGAGSRKCIGNHFAMAEGVLLLAKMLKNFNLELVDKNVNAKAVLTLRPTQIIRANISAR